MEQEECAKISSGGEFLSGESQLKSANSSGGKSLKRLHRVQPTDCCGVDKVGAFRIQGRTHMYGDAPLVALLSLSRRSEPGDQDLTLFVYCSCRCSISRVSCQLWRVRLARPATNPSMSVIADSKHVWKIGIKGIAFARLQRGQQRPHSWSRPTPPLSQWASPLVQIALCFLCSRFASPVLEAMYGELLIHSLQCLVVQSEVSIPTYCPPWPL